MTTDEHSVLSLKTKPTMQIKVLKIALFNGFAQSTVLCFKMSSDALREA
jgi:hypothetical protein